MQTTARTPTHLYEGKRKCDPQALHHTHSEIHDGAVSMWITFGRVRAVGSFNLGQPPDYPLKMRVNGRLQKTTFGEARFPSLRELFRWMDNWGIIAEPPSVAGFEARIATP